jgi:hypothetical protein
MKTTLGIAVGALLLLGLLCDAGVAYLNVYAGPDYHSIIIDSSGDEHDHVVKFITPYLVVRGYYETNWYWPTNEWMSAVTVPAGSKFPFADPRVIRSLNNNRFRAVVAAVYDTNGIEETSYLVDP